jgi:hypothetical protein
MKRLCCNTAMLGYIPQYANDVCPKSLTSEALFPLYFLDLYFGRLNEQRKTTML